MLRKLLRQRWPWALAGSAALAMAVGFTASLVQQRDRARDAEALARQSAERALQQAETTRDSSRFLMSVLTGADPKLTGVPDLPKSMVLSAQGRDRFQQEVAHNASLRARLQVVLGDVYERIGRTPDAIAAYTEAAQLFASPELAQPLAQADALRRLALAYNNSGQIELAEAPARLTVKLREQFDPKNRTDLAEAENRLGIVLINLRRYDEAGQHLEHALKMFTELKGADDNNSLSTLHNLARLNRSRGDPQQAEIQMRRVLEVARRTRAPLDDRTLGSMEEYGRVLSDLKRHLDAERVLREAVAGWTKVFGAGNGNVAIAQHKLGRALSLAGRHDEGLVEMLAALRIETAQGTRHTVRSGMAHIDIALAHDGAGRLPEAEQAGRDAISALQAAAGTPALTLAAAQHGLAHRLWRQGRAADARQALAPALALRNARLPEGNDERVASGELDAALRDAQTADVDKALGLDKGKRRSD